MLAEHPHRSGDSKINPKSQRKILNQKCCRAHRTAGLCPLLYFPILDPWLGRLWCGGGLRRSQRGWKLPVGSKAIAKSHGSLCGPDGNP